MSLSWWGQRSPETTRPRARWSKTAFAIALVLSAVVSGGAGGRGASADPSPALQALLDQHLRALLERDEFSYEFTLDPRQHDLVYCAKAGFGIGDRFASSLAPLRLRRVERIGPSLVRGYVEQGAALVPYYSRELGVSWMIGKAPFEFTRSSTRWYISEPTALERGPRREATIDGIDVRYFTIDEPFVPAVAAAAAAGRDVASARAGIAVPEQLRVRLYLHGLHRYAYSGRRCFIDGTLGADGATPEIRLFRVALERDLRRVTPGYRSLLIHEAGHWAQEQRLPKSRYGEWWLKEGWAEFVAARDHRIWIELLLCAGRDVPTAAELARGPSADEWNRPANRFYPSAASAVAYLIESFGEHAYWNLLELSGARLGSGDVYSSALGIERQEFFERWQSWAQKRHCGAAPSPTRLDRDSGDGRLRSIASQSP